MTNPAFLVSLRDLAAPAGVVPCMALSRGLNTAARDFAVPFVINLTMVYFSAGQQVRVVVHVPIKDTIEGQALDEQTVLVEARVDVQADGTPVPPCAAKSPVTASLRITYVDPQDGTIHEAIEPFVTQTTIP